MNSKRLLLPLVVLAALLAGCASKDCYDNKNSLPLATFYRDGEHGPTQVSLDSVKVYGVGAPRDSVLVDTASSIQELFLPFRIDAGSTTYVIDYVDTGHRGMADTVTFNYDAKPWFVSEACGAIYIYEMKSIETTKWLLDSVTCPQGIIDNKPVSNLYFYLKERAGEL